jgi:hypothetical protein
VKEGRFVRYEVETTLSPDKVLEQARVFFGDGGLGLKLEQATETTLYFTGGGGSVAISVAANPRTTVEFVEREWETQMREFAHGLPR